jgi:hypothetical protein
MSPPPVHKSHLASRDERPAFLCRFLVRSRQELVVSILRKSQTPSSLSHSQTQDDNGNDATRFQKAEQRLAAGLTERSRPSRISPSTLRWQPTCPWRVEG